MANSIAAPLERRLGEIAGVTELTSISARSASTIDRRAVRHRPRHRRRRARRAGGDQRRDARPAVGPADPAVLPQVQPGRRADHDASRCPRTRCRTAQIYDAADTHPGAAAVAGRRRRAGAGRTARRSRRCACGSIRRALAAAGLSAQDVVQRHPRRQRHRHRPAASRGRSAPRRIGLNGQIIAAPRNIAPLVLKTSNGARPAPVRRRERDRRRRQHRGWPPGTASSRRSC